MKRTPLKTKTQLKSKAPLKRKSRSETAILHDKLWKLVSRYCRLRDCLRTTGWPDRGQCITCNKEYEFSVLDGGHFKNKHLYGSVKYDEKNVHAQCTYCNRTMHGALDKYFVALELLYGREELDSLIERSKIKHQWKAPELRELIEVYTQKLKSLEGV